MGILKYFVLFLLIGNGFPLAYASDSLSYSGRLTNANGSPAVGPVKLRFDLVYTNDQSIILCSQQMTGVDLVNGVFHVKIDFNCPSSNLKTVLENIPANNSIAIRVTDETSSTPKMYSYQALHSVPLTIMAKMSKQLVQMDATEGQVLTWSGTEWTAKDPASTTQGTVTNITTTDGLYGGPITDSGIIGLADGGVTSQKLNQMGATPGQVLKWTLAGWAPDSDNDTTPAAESDPHVLKFARSDMLGMPIPDNCAADEKLQYAPAMQTFVCSPIILNDSAVQSAVVADAINDNEINKAPSQNAVFDALAGKQNTVDSNSDLVLRSLKFTNPDGTWIGLKAPTGGEDFFFTFPLNTGTNGQVLKTDGSGNLSWVNVTTGTITEVTSVAPLSGSGTSGSVNLSLNYDNTTIGLTGANLSVKDGGITNSKIGASANIDWAKINKLGAVASDVGAVPTARTISTGTGLLGGGDFSANRTLSVDVGTTANKIVQVEADGKLPAIDGSKLTDLVWSQILTSTLPVITAGTGLTSTGSLATGQTLNVDVGTTANKIVSLDASARLPAVDGSQLTNLGTNLGKWSNATGGIHYSAGNVGVGITTPLANLEVKQIGTSMPFRVSKSDGTAIMTTDWAGRILMDTTSNSTVPMLTIGNGNFSGRLLVLNGKTGFVGNLMEVKHNSVDQMIVTYDGKVGIGTTSPSQKLHVSSGSIELSSDFSIGNSIGSGSSDRSITPNYTTMTSLGGLGPSAPYTNGMLLKSDELIGFAEVDTNSLIGYFDVNSKNFIWDGKIGVGTTTPTQALDVVGNAKVSGSVTAASYTGSGAGLTNISPSSHVHFHNYPAGYSTNVPFSVNNFNGVHGFQDYSGVAMNMGGTFWAGVGVSNGSTGAQFAVNWNSEAGGPPGFKVRAKDDTQGDWGAWRSVAFVDSTVSKAGDTITGNLVVNGNISTGGCLYYNSGTLGTCVSDQRLKENMKPFSLGLKEVLGIDPVFFNYNGLGDIPVGKEEQLGVIAQQVEKAAPGLIVKKKMKLRPEDENETEIKAVNYSAFTYTLINATKELYEMIADLFSRDEENKREIASIKEENAQMKAYICKKDPEASFCSN